MNNNWWFAALSIVAGALAAITHHPLFGFLGFAIAVGLIIWDYLGKEASEQRRKDGYVEVSPADWSVRWEQQMAMSAELVIPELKHGKGRNINVRIKQSGLRRWDLEDEITESGDIVIRYARNNFPSDPRISLRVYVSGRG